MRSTTLLAALLFVSVTADAHGGVLRIPLTHYATDTAPFSACSSSGRLKAFYGEFRTGISIQLTGLIGEENGDGVPCSGDEYKCLFETNFGTILLRPEAQDGRARSEHDLCAETGLCPTAGFPIAVGSFRVRCFARGFTDYNPALFLPFDPPYDCEGIELGSLPEPGAPLIARDGVMLTCP